MSGKRFQPHEEQFNADELAMSEAIAAYLEELNSGTPLEVSAFAGRYPHINQAELEKSLKLFAIPRQPIAMPDVNTAWQKFSAKNFKLVNQPSMSLGNYVQQAIDTGDNVLAAAKLPSASLEALKQDPTPVSALRNYELGDYAALAKRYGVKDALFPRLLKWLKGVGKTMTMPATPARGMVYARPTDRQQYLTEQDIEQALEGDGFPVTGDSEKE